MPVVPVMFAALAANAGTIGAATIGAGAIAGGVSAYESSKQEAALQKAQGTEAVREAQVNAGNEAYNQTQAVQRQRLAFLANGVSLEGSPTKVLETSRQYGQSQVDEIIRQGYAKASLAGGEADITANKGRAALIEGMSKGVGGTMGGYMSQNPSTSGSSPTGDLSGNAGAGAGQPQT